MTRTASAPTADLSPATTTAAARDPTIPLFWTFLVVHVAAWTVVPALAQRCLPLDTVEMLYWGHEWQWGYYKHPPLPAWIAETVWLVCGTADWPIYLASQVSVGLTFLAAWLLARRILAPGPALATVMLLEAFPFLSFTTPQWNNNGPPKAGWAWAVLLVHRGLTTGDRKAWVGAGAALGLALLAKYDAVVLIASMLAFLAIHPRARPAWRTAGPWLMLATAAAVFAPHAAWLLAGDAPTLAYLRSRAPETRTLLDHVTSPLAFLAAQVAAVGGIPLLCASVFGWRGRPVPATGERRFDRDFLLAMVLGPPCLAMTVAAVTGIAMVPVWGSPMWTFFGLLLWVLYEPPATTGDLRRLMWRSAACGAALLVAFATAKVFHSELSGRVTRVQYPGRRIAAEIEDRWRAVTAAPLRLVGGEWWLAGVTAYYHPRRPHVYPDLRPDWAPWTDDEDLRRHGGVIVWPGSGPMPAAWRRRFPEAVVGPPLELPVRGFFRELEVGLGVAIVPPAAGV